MLAQNVPEEVGGYLIVLFVGELGDFGDGRLSQGVDESVEDRCVIACGLLFRFEESFTDLSVNSKPDDGLGENSPFGQVDG